MGAYVDVNGLSMYYEAAGEGEPVVLVHGTGGFADSWTAQRGRKPAARYFPMGSLRSAVEAEKKGAAETGKAAGPSGVSPAGEPGTPGAPAAGGGPGSLPRAA
ncbi:MAG TPA: hypothetical protein VGD91_00595 [Trebonia sp.]